MPLILDFGSKTAIDLSNTRVPIHAGEWTVGVSILREIVRLCAALLYIVFLAGCSHPPVEVGFTLGGVPYPDKNIDSVVLCEFPGGAFNVQEGVAGCASYNGLMFESGETADLRALVLDFTKQRVMRANFKVKKGYKQQIAPLTQTVSLTAADEGCP